MSAVRRERTWGGGLAETMGPPASAPSAGTPRMPGRPFSERVRARDPRVATLAIVGSAVLHVVLLVFLLPAFAPDDVSHRMRRYAGSVSFDTSGRYAAVSHPREGIVSLWSVRTARLLAVAALADTCGIARGAGAGLFIATGAKGQIARIDARTGESTVLVRSDGSHWDNHLLALRTRA